MSAARGARRCDRVAPGSLIRGSMERMRQLVGRERSLREISQALHFAARQMNSAGVGAMHVTCADESENECVDRFQQGFVQYLLPPLKFARAAAFRLANLGGRYEWGAVRLAEAHFATPRLDKRVKLLVVKINAHVAFEELGASPDAMPGAVRRFRLGIYERYGRDSHCCGALHALLHGAGDPATQELRESFQSESHDRLATLLDDTRVDPPYRPLFAALVSARLQARRVVLDIQDYQPVSPTFFLVIPCVTINRHERDTEIVAGLYTIDGKDGGRDAVYYGLGDDPGEYDIKTRNRQFVVTDEQVGRARMGRDHRALVRKQWQQRTENEPVTIEDERLERIRADVFRNKHRHHGHARKLLRAALPILAEVAPVPAAVLLFADGIVGIHHTFRVHKLASEMRGTHEARQILDEVETRIDQLDPDRAEALIELLINEYR